MNPYSAFPSQMAYYGPPMQQQQPQDQGFGHALYSGAADVGKAKAYIGAAVGTVLAIVLVIAGIIVMLQPPSKCTDPVTATVTAVQSCTQLQGDTPAQFDCSMTVQYTYKGTLYTSPLELTSGTTYTVNAAVPILVNPSQPTQISGTTGISSLLLGGILIGFGFFVFVVTFFIAYLAHRSKAFAALEGASVGVNAVRGLFGR